MSQAELRLIICCSSSSICGFDSRLTAVIFDSFCRAGRNLS